MRNTRMAGVMAAAVAMALSLGLRSKAQASERHSEEFHHTYALTSDGLLSLSNVNGDVHITSWDRDEVKVDAIKSADSEAKLADIQIRIDAEPDSIRIKTEYPQHLFHNNPGRVDYTLTVPKRARLKAISLVNGALDIQGVAGDVEASAVNGRINTLNLAGNLKLNSVNGRINASFDRPDVNRSISINSVNGQMQVDLPADVNADLHASTVNGGISDDFGLPDEHHFVGHNVSGKLGSGGGRIELSSVNGRIEIRKTAAEAN